MNTELGLLKRANDLLRSCYAVASREGKTTNWEGLKSQIDKALREQHESLKGKYTESSKIDPVLDNIKSGSHGGIPPKVTLTKVPREETVKMLLKNEGKGDKLNPEEWIDNSAYGSWLDPDEKKVLIAIINQYLKYIES